MIYRCTQLRQSPTPPCVFPQGLDKTLIGDYLGEREDFSLKVTGGGGHSWGGRRRPGYWSFYYCARTGRPTLIDDPPPLSL